LKKLKSGDPTWESMVPPQVVKIIKERKLLGYQPGGAQPSPALAAR